MIGSVRRVSAYNQLIRSIEDFEKWQSMEGLALFRYSNPYVSEEVTWEGVYMGIALARRTNPLFELMIAEGIHFRVERLLTNIEHAVEAITSWRIA